MENPDYLPSHPKHTMNTDRKSSNMKKEMKYNLRIVQDDDSWSAEITRRKTARETVVTKRQSDFASESEAQEWGQMALKEILETVKERNRRRSEQDN